MAKSPSTITVALPGYERDRGRWRRAIHSAAFQAAAKAGVLYDDNEPLEITVLLFLKEGKRLLIHDVDNRLKDILDALQGRFGRAKSPHHLIRNDSNVYRVVMEKQKIPKLYGADSNPGGRLMIRPYRRHRWPLQPAKGHRLSKARKGARA
jgi:hypothetical protein